MAITSYSASMISRSKGKSVLAAAAYRSGEKLYNERTEKTYDYTRKKGIVYTDLLTPTNAPEWAHDRSKLWNAVEQSETAY